MGFVGLFGGGKPQVDLALDRTTVVPGDTVHATIRVTGDEKDAEIEEGRLELVCAVTYTYRYRSSSRSGTTTRTATDTEESIVQWERFLERGTVGAGSSSGHSVELQIPHGTVASADAKITSVWWAARAILNRRRANDVESKVRLRVLAPREADAAAGEQAQEVESHGDLELALRLNGHDVGPDATIEGALVAKALSDCEVTDIRVQLERLEVVPFREGNEQRVVEVRTSLAEDTAFAAGETREFPIRIPVPDALAPCISTGFSSIRWFLRGVGARRLRSDYHVLQELNVYTAGADALPGRPM